MKYFYIGLLILCLLLCACWFSTRAVQGKSHAMLMPLRDALEAFRRGDKTACAQAVGEAKRRWEHSEPVLESLLSHERVLDISDELVRLEYAPDEAFEQICIGMMAKLERIGEMDIPKLHNIL